MLNLLENVAECEVTTGNIAEAWNFFSSDEKLAVEASITQMNDLRELVQRCVMQWKRLRNIPFFQVMMIWKKYQMPQEILEQLIRSYQEQMDQIANNIEFPDSLRKLSFSQIMPLMHPAYWPTCGKGHNGYSNPFSDVTPWIRNMELLCGSLRISLLAHNSEMEKWSV